MKKIILAAILLFGVLITNAQRKAYISFDAGTSNKLTPVVSMYGGIEIDMPLKPFAEIGIRSHVDNKNIAFASLNAGLEYKSISFIGGIAYGGGRQKQDRYINPHGETMVLSEGAQTSTFISPVVAARWTIRLKESNSNIFIQPTYCQKVIFGSIGLKCVFGE